MKILTEIEKEIVKAKTAAIANHFNIPKKDIFVMSSREGVDHYGVYIAQVNDIAELFVTEIMEDSSNEWDGLTRLSGTYYFFDWAK